MTDSCRFKLCFPPPSGIRYAKRRHTIVVAANVWLIRCCPAVKLWKSMMSFGAHLRLPGLKTEFRLSFSNRPCPT